MPSSSVTPRRPSAPSAMVVAALSAILATMGAVGAAAHADQPSQASPDPNGSTTTSTTSGGALVPTTPTTRDTPATTSTSAPVTSSTTAPTQQAPTTTLANGEGGKPKGAPSIPPDAQAQINAVLRSGPNNSAALVLALQQLRDLGISEEEITRVGYGQFPVAGRTTFVDDWLFPRYVPTFHLHQGTDVFGAFGTPVRAPFDGVLKQTSGAVGGLAAYVTLPDGTYVYMAHLQSFAVDMVDGQPVRQGDVVGFVGDTGDARGGAPHVHFEIHPKGGAAVDPKATLDAWLANAVLDVPRLVGESRRLKGIGAPASVTGVPSLASTAGGAGVVLAAFVPSPAGAVADGATGSLWAVAANPAVGATHVASALASHAADTIDWGSPIDPGQGTELTAPPTQAAALLRALAVLSI